MNTKLALAALACLASVSAFCADATFSKTVAIKSLSDTVESTFVVNLENPELGRAWVRVIDTYENPFSADDSGHSTNEIDVAIPNLKFNSATGEIIFKKESGESEVCAKNVHRALFGGLKFETTGRCQLSVTKHIVKSDDGFYLHTSWGADVTFKP